VNAHNQKSRFKIHICIITSIIENVDKLLYTLQRGLKRWQLISIVELACIRKEDSLSF